MTDPTPSAPSSVLDRAHIGKDDVALLVLRLAAALPLGFHGTQKLFGWFGGGGLTGFAGYLETLGAPMPTLAALLAAVSEVGGALVLCSGRGFRALPPVVFTMVVATAASSRNGFDVQRGGAEFPLALTALLVAIALLGPGALVIGPRRAEVAR